MAVERWLSVKEIAKHLGIRIETVYRWLDVKKMPGHKAGRHWKFKRDEVDKWIRSGGAEENELEKHEGE
jgi:excisionase family DNA binding protein